MIQARLSTRLGPREAPIPLIAETGGLNAMIVDSSALAEQVVGDAITSAFDSAGQRCSALRLLCLQEDIADRVLIMLKGAMQELSVGDPGKLATDVGPVITREALTAIESHVDGLQRRGCRVERAELNTLDCAQGTFVPPTVIEIQDVADLRREVFGPVLHVLRYRRANLASLMEEINATGYGLTFGLHSRIDETIDLVTERIAAGNIYVNRNIIGAVVGVQPFGGNGLSGTGPKAGGPRYLARLTTGVGGPADGEVGNAPALAVDYQRFLVDQGHTDSAERVAKLLLRVPATAVTEFSGPVGERNLLAVKPRGRIVVIAETAVDLMARIGAVLATGNDAVVPVGSPADEVLAHLPAELARHVDRVDDWRRTTPAGVLVSGAPAHIASVTAEAGKLAGPIIIVQGNDYRLDLLMREVSISINTAAAGGKRSIDVARLTTHAAFAGRLCRSQMPMVRPVG